MSEFNWEGYPKGLEDWMRRQGHPVTIFYDGYGEFRFVLGHDPLETYEQCGRYLVEKNGYCEVEFPTSDEEDSDAEI